MSDDGATHAWEVELLFLDRSQLKQVSTLFAELEHIIDELSGNYLARVQKVTRVYMDDDDEDELVAELTPEISGTV